MEKYYNCSSDRGVEAEYLVDAGKKPGEPVVLDPHVEYGRLPSQLVETGPLPKARLAAGSIKMHSSMSTGA